MMERSLKASLKEKETKIEALLSSVKSFSILPKNTFSDHSPLAIELSRKPRTSLALIARCVHYTFNDDHNDINRRVMKPVKMKDINVVNTISEIRTLAERIAAHGRTATQPQQTL